MISDQLVLRTILFSSWVFAASEGRIPMEKVWAEGHQR